MDIRKSLDMDLFGNVIPEKELKEKPKETIVLRGTIADIPSRPFTVHRISPTEVWIIHEDKKPLPG